MYNYSMKRNQIYLTDMQKEQLTKLAQKKGISMSELIRRILDDYLEGKK